MQKPVSEGNDLNPNGASKNALKDFQLSESLTDKTSKDFGAKIVLQVEEIINSGYFNERNARFALNRAMDTGRMNIQKFMDFFNINGMTNYVNINWKSIMIVNTIVSRLVGRWMTKRQKASVTAVDDISIKQKKKEKDDAEFYMYNQQHLQELGAEAGADFIPKDQFIPDDKDHLDLWAEEEQRIPEEILYEKGINTVFDLNGWGENGVNTRRVKHDAAVVGLVGTETIADKNGRIHVNYCRPENMFYSYSDRPDFSDSSIKGEIVSYKISEIRDLYPKLTMKELMEIGKESKQWSGPNKITYDTAQWHTNMFLPIDDWNVDVVRFTLRSLDVDRNLIKKAKDGSMYVDRPKKRIKDVYPGNEYVEKTVWNIYRGVYVRQNKMILEWGLEKNMVRPQDYEKISDAQSPYSFYMYQNNQMRNLAIPEKIEEPVEGMILARLKIQQLVAKMRPSGYQYDIDGLQAMDLGNGIAKPLELQKITDQTGNVYYRSRDAEGNRIESPVRELPNAGSTAQLQALIEIYNQHLQVLRDEIGINEFAEGQTIKPRTGVENVQTAMEVSFNATDYMNDACIALMDESADKVACLLHDSVEFGSKEYRDLLQEKDIKDRDFKVKIEMLPTTEEITNFDQTVNQMMASQPDLVLWLNPEKLKRMARKNVKQAERYLMLGQRRAYEGRMKQAESQAQMNANAQKESGLAVEAAKQESLKAELMVKMQIEQASSHAKQKEAIVAGFFSIYSKGLQVPPELKKLEAEMIKNSAIPLFVENVQSEQELQQQAEEAQMQQEEQSTPEGMEGQMQPQMEEQMQ